MAVARGEAPPEMLVTGGTVLNVYSGELLPATVAIAAGRIAYVGGRPFEAGPATATLDARNRIIAPGYIDPHGHPHVLYTPDQMARAALPLGTTAVVADTLLLLMLVFPDQIDEAMSALAGLPMHYFWFLRLHSQSHMPNEEAFINDDLLARLLQREDVRTGGEVTRWPLAHAGDATILARMATALAAGRRVEGHAPGASAERVQVLAAAGFSSEHEAVTAEQAMARLRSGLYVMLRHGSLRPDLPALAAVATGARAASGRLMLTPDGASPSFLREHGYMDHVLASAMRAGIEATAAYQMATVNPAAYYGLDEEIGGLAPGRLADFVVLESLEHPRPEVVVAGGRVVGMAGRLVGDLPALPWERWLRPLARGSWRPDPSLFSLEGLPNPAPAMHLESTVIAARRDVAHNGALPPGVMRIALIDPDGRWRSRALLSGFADDVGGLACTYSSGPGVITIGLNADDMAAAAARALDLGGGIVLVEGGAVRFELPLPLGGMMSTKTIGALATDLDRLTALLRARGYRHQDLTYTLLFLDFDALPYARLTYRGLWDVIAGREILPREDLT
ncbi:MAG: adenine deaminase C-terminal domain-containing protein [Armatimonadota bacterium]